MLTIIKTNILHSISLEQSEYLENYFIVINDGIFRFISANKAEVLSYLYEIGVESTDLESSGNYYDLTHYILTPGFIDLHTHLPQVFVRNKTGLELLDWLNTYIFPEELKYKNIDYAYKASEAFFDNLIKQGTTTACVYTSTFEDAAKVSFEVAQKKNLRVFMGNTLMDVYNTSGLELNTNKNISISETLIDKFHNTNTGKLQYILTPRFAGSCSKELLRYVGKKAVESNLKIQTHLSENTSEISFMLSLFPEAESYLDIYKRYNLLQTHTIFAHSIYLSKKELDSIKRHNCAIAHCPTSNRFLQSGIMRAKQYLDLGLNIGLGTDIGAGYSFSILNESKEALESAKTLNLFEKQPYESNGLTVENTFYLATLGGAKALGLQSQLGNIEVGKLADFLLFDKNKIEQNGSYPLHREKDIPTEKQNLKCPTFSLAHTLLSNLIYNSEIYKPEQVFVAGKRLV